jgi:hypothetical protein
VADLLQPAYSCSERAARSMTKEQIAATHLGVIYWHAVPDTARSKSRQTPAS